VALLFWAAILRFALILDYFKPLVLGEELLLIQEGPLGSLAPCVPSLLMNDFPGHSDGPRGLLGVLWELNDDLLRFSSHLLLDRGFLLVRLRGLALIVLLVMLMYKLHHFPDDPCGLLLFLSLLGEVQLSFEAGYHLLLLLLLLSVCSCRRHGDVKTVPQVVPLFNQIENGLNPLVVWLCIEGQSLRVVQQRAQLERDLPQEEIVRIPHLEDALLSIFTLQKVQGEDT
jgi:hypothetical protein